MADGLEQNVRLVRGERVPNGTKLQAADVVILSGENRRRIEGLPVIRRERDGTIYYATEGAGGPRVAVLKGSVIVDYIPQSPYPAQRQ